MEQGGENAGASSVARTVTPYEKNLDVWRQLWRVVERSDVLVQIVDARMPTFYQCVTVVSCLASVYYLRYLGSLLDVLCALYLRESVWLPGSTCAAVR